MTSALRRIAAIEFSGVAWMMKRKNVIKTRIRAFEHNVRQAR